MNSKILYVLLLLTCIRFTKSQSQAGPDPWNHDGNEVVSMMVSSGADIPPDLKIPLKRKATEIKDSPGIGEWSFRRTLAILLKGGQNKKNEDDSVDISLQMKFEKERWHRLDEYLKSDTAFSEDMFRRALGYLEDAICKPTVTDKIVMAWTDYIQHYLIEYKIYFTWTLGMAGAVAAFIWLWNHMSHKHMIIIIFIVLYLYEVFVSYKEAEQQDLQRFISAVNTCKWYFWTSSCEVPPPDLVIFMKHMNPLKIAIRIFTTLISEPMLTLSATVNTIIHSITDGLWFPLDKMLFVLLTVSINILLIVFLIMIIFNYILNSPFNLNLGLLGIILPQRNRSLFPSNTQNNEPNRVETVDRIRGDTLNRILDVCTLALDTAVNSRRDERTRVTNSSNLPRIRRSASTGRLPTGNSSLENNQSLILDSNVRRRRNVAFQIGDIGGSGDAN